MNIRKWLEKHGWWWHWQNLNIKENERGRVVWKGNPLIDGRAWLHTPIANRGNIGFQWCFIKTKSFSFGFDVGSDWDEDDFRFRAALPFLFAFYLSFEGFISSKSKAAWKWWPKRESKETSIRILDSSIWIYIWQSEGCHSNKDGWHRIVIHPLDIILGKQKYSKRTISITQDDIEMPEGHYPCQIEMFESTWKRPRSPFARKVLRADMDISKNPIPIPGKGENSWDQGDDATYSMTTSASTVKEAKARLVESLLETRERYGGANWKGYVVGR